MDAIILAGGKGTRLRPYTVSIPKPLVPLGEHPIIEIILKQLSCNGVRRVHIALGHLAELLKAYFAQVNDRYDLEIRYSQEEVPLGTAGPIKRIEGLADSFLLLNGDILTTLSYSDLVAFHKSRGVIATLAIHTRKVHIDYGVVDVGSNSLILGHREKPSLEYRVGMGVCVFEPEIVNYIPDNQRFDIPDLISRLLAEGQEIAAYESNDYWMDIGRPDDYETAFEDYTASPDRFLGGK